MADGREVHVWTQHAEEQWEMNKPHKVSDDALLRLWLLEVDPKNVLDLGCGSGLWRYLFEDFDYTGADQNEQMIHYAKKRYPEHADSFKVISWDNPEFAAGSFDMVFTSAVIQHNKHAEKDKVMEGIVRLLAKGGHYMCTETTFTPENYHHAFPNRPPFHDGLSDGYSFTKAGWVNYMKKFGLELEKFCSPGEYLFIKE